MNDTVKEDHVQEPGDKYVTIPIFGDVIGHAAVGTIDDWQEKLKKLEWDHGDFDQTSSKEIHLEEDWKVLAESIEHHANEWLKEMGVAAEVFINKMWANYFKPDEEIHEHTHPGAFLSGVYYFQKSSGTVFRRKHPIGPLESFAPEIMDVSKLTAGKIHTTASPGTAIFFMSDMPHTSGADWEDRYTISFNMLPKEIGSESNTTGHYKLND